jgi:hypothetical protein
MISSKTKGSVLPVISNHYPEESIPKPKFERSGGSSLGSSLSFSLRSGKSFSLSLRALKDKFSVSYIERNAAQLSGDLVGKKIMEKKGTQGRGKAMRVKKFIDHAIKIKHPYLPDLVKKHDPYFRYLIIGMISTKLRLFLERKAVRMSTSDLSTITNEEAFTIGLSLSLYLNENSTAVSGVDQWRSMNKPVDILCDESPFFLAFTEAVALEKLSKAPWGLGLRVSLGALLSMVDVGTDIYAINTFYEQKHYGLAKAMIGAVSFSIALQTAFGISIHYKKGYCFLVKDFLITISGLKPAFDAYHMTVGTATTKLDVVSPLSGILTMKLVEALMEGVPGAIIQSYAFLINPDKNSLGLSPLISIGISMMSVGYSIT